MLLLVCADLYQLPPVTALSLYNNSELVTLRYVVIDLWQRVKIAELTEMQQGDDEMINMLDKVRIGNIDEYTENHFKFFKFLNLKFVDKNDPLYPVEAIHIFAEDFPVNEHNEEMLNRLSHPLVNIYAMDEIPTADHIPECEISAARHRKHSETGGIALKLVLKLEARVMGARYMDNLMWIIYISEYNMLTK